MGDPEDYKALAGEDGDPEKESNWFCFPKIVSVTFTFSRKNCASKAVKYYDNDLVGLIASDIVRVLHCGEMMVTSFSLPSDVLVKW